MALSTNEKKIDYLLVGHITEDLLDDGTSLLGGTASYSGLTASALGHQVGLLTSLTKNLDISPLDGMRLEIVPTDHNTTFRNVPTPDGRKQYLFYRACGLDASHVPQYWRKADIVHLGPVACEIDPEIYKAFSASMICVTPQGWLRGVREDGSVFPVDWAFSSDLLQAAHAVVLSLEDLRGDENMVEKISGICKLLVVTENSRGARVYWNGDVRRFPAPQMPLIEDTGAGDIFAACFFHRLFTTRDPWEAARFAVQLAALSVSRRHFASIPTLKEIAQAKVQVI